ncbi:hypothetical protein ES319_D05G121200v1 [Gossypium barbadense]|uniref:Uncharacterized protein n=3 Tax=Gossypium TaxID=3633 RepID=A0A5J5RCV7_GOSBA|nr:hypothetical protein ES319_D05G121200v1 [Gossypium barbadense]TYG68102.1 hypothetical protein ES288_D05G126800v1 [Gossypium darwinii]TYG68103.1 hypothetical protein ES288_D05G126800v1 [Gossypium darwinii]
MDMIRVLCRYLLISIPFPLHRLPIGCHMNPILPLPNFQLRNTQTVAISCFFRLQHSSPSSKFLLTEENHTHLNLRLLCHTSQKDTINGIC